MLRRHRALRPGGELILSTPNPFGLTPVLHTWLLGREAVNAQHTCYFSRRTLRHLVERYGFRIRAIHLAGRPSRWPGLERARVLFMRLRRDMAETLVLVAAKPTVDRSSA